MDIIVGGFLFFDSIQTTEWNFDTFRVAEFHFFFLVHIYSFKIRPVYTERSIYYRKYLLKITQPSQYR